MSNYSYVTHLGDGSTTMFALSVSGENIGYFRTSDIHAYVDDLEVPFTINPASPHLVIIQPAPAQGAEVLLRRQVPADRPYADFMRGNNFGQRQVNNTFLQQLYLTQEIIDGFYPEGYYSKQDLNMGGHILTNLGDGSDATDSVNKGQLDMVDEKHTTWNGEQDERMNQIEQSLAAGDLTYRRVIWYAEEGQELFNPNAIFSTVINLYVNGVHQTPLDNYEVIDGQLIRVYPLTEGDKVVAIIGQEPQFQEPEQVDFRYLRLPIFATGGETTLTVPINFESVSQLYLNGIHQTYQTSFEYDSNSNTVTVAEPLEGGDEVLLYLGFDPVTTDQATVDYVNNSIGSAVDALEETKDINHLYHAEADSVYIHSFWPEDSFGGGWFVKKQLPKSEHNGVTVVSPTVPGVSSQAGLSDWYAGSGEEDPSGVGVYVRTEAGYNYTRSSWAGCSPNIIVAPATNAEAIHFAYSLLDVPSLGEGKAAKFTVCEQGVTELGSNPITLYGVDVDIDFEGQLKGNVDGPLVTYQNMQQVGILNPEVFNESFHADARAVFYENVYTATITNPRYLLDKFLRSDGITCEMQGNGIVHIGGVMRYGRRNLLITDGSNRVANYMKGVSLDRCGEGQVEVNQTSNIPSQTIFDGGYLEMSSELDGETSALVKIHNRPQVVFRDVYMSARASNRFFEFTGTVREPSNVQLIRAEINNIGTGGQAFLIRNNNSGTGQLMTIDDLTERLGGGPINKGGSAYVAGNHTEAVTVINADFTQDLSGWVTTGNTAHGDSDEVGSTALGYLETSFTSANAYQLFKVIPGERYRVTCYARRVSGEAGAQLSVRETDLSTIIASSENGNLTSQEVEVLFTPSVSRVAVILRQVGNGGAQFSQVRFEKLL